MILWLKPRKNKHEKGEKMLFVKNRNDPRYVNKDRDIREAIEAFNSEGHMFGMTVRQIARRAKINVTTFSRHHRSIDKAMRNIDKQVCNDFRNFLDNLDGKSYSDVEKFVLILSFVQKNKDYFDNTLGKTHGGSLLGIVKMVKPRIVRHWPKYNEEILDRLYAVFIGEVIGVLTHWVLKEEYDKTKMHSHAEYINWLFTTAPKRLVRAV